MSILLRLLGLAWRHPRHLLAAYFFLFASNAFALMVPRLLGETIDEVLGSGTNRALWGFAGAILLVYGLRGLFAYGQQYLGEWASQLVAYDLRNALYNRLQRLSFAFHDTQQTGNLMSKATADVEAIRMFIQAGMLRATQILVLIGGTAGVLLVTNWRLALVGLAFVPLVVWRAAVVNIVLRRLWLHIQTVLGRLTTVLQENLTGVRVVRAFGAQRFEEEKFQDIAQDISDSTVESSRLQASNTALMVFFFSVATGAILWVGGQEIVAGRLTTGELAQFIFYMGLITGPVRMSGFIINSFSRAVSAGQRVFEVLDAPSPVQERNGARVLERVRGHVRFEDISFAYDGDAPVLRDISFEARPGQVVALLGGPGSGKTSVAHLVPRFYDVTSGRVTVDGVDVRDTTLASLRKHVGIVMQDVFLFSDTIKENIAYGRPGASMGEIQRAAQIAQLHDFIVGLPEGYETLVGERGITLSGGQRQRLAIARTLLLDPPILILDDTTSSVDANTEHLLREALKEVMKGRTTFVIAHRISTVRSADLILVLADGAIVERGAHGELMRLDGPYRQVYDLQLLPEEPDVEVAFQRTISRNALREAPVGDGNGSK